MARNKKKNYNLQNDINKIVPEIYRNLLWLREIPDLPLGIGNIANNIRCIKIWPYTCT